MICFPRFSLQRLPIMMKLKQNRFHFIYNSSYKEKIKCIGNRGMLAKNDDVQCKRGDEPVGKGYTELEMKIK